jgi:hypothetical protein
MTCSCPPLNTTSVTCLTSMYVRSEIGKELERVGEEGRSWESGEREIWGEGGRMRWREVYMTFSLLFYKHSLALVWSNGKCVVRWLSHHL